MKQANSASADLRTAFPDMKGRSTSNLEFMRYFARECPDHQIGQQSADQLHWFDIGGDMAAPSACAGTRLEKSGAEWN
jgi:hypothetical protein